MFEGYSYNRRDETATPLCGTHRQPTKNALLTKAQLGCVRGTSYDLPEDFGFTYGMANVRAAGGPSSPATANHAVASAHARARRCLCCAAAAAAVMDYCCSHLVPAWAVWALLADCRLVRRGWMWRGRARVQWPSSRGIAGSGSAS